MEQAETTKKESAQSSQKQKEEQKAGKLKEVLKRIVKPLAETALVVASAAIISTNCTTEFKSDDHDTSQDTGDVEEVGGEDTADVHMEDIVSGDVILEIEDVDEDRVIDVEGEDAVIECNPIEDVRIITIAADTIELVGNIGVRYNGLNGVEASYDILCGDVVVKSDVRVPVSGVEVVDLSSEYGFRVELRVSSADSSSSRVRVTVDAH